MGGVTHRFRPQQAATTTMWISEGMAVDSGDDDARAEVAKENAAKDEEDLLDL